MIIVENSHSIQLNEMLVNVIERKNSVDLDNSVYYAKIKHAMFSDINSFCKEKIELRRDLHFLRDFIGMTMTEEEIREHIEDIMDRYNAIEENIGIHYHLEATRVDFGVPIFVTLKRGDNIYMTKFVYRFKKRSNATGVGRLSSGGALKNNITNELVGG